MLPFNLTTSGDKLIESKVSTAFADLRGTG